MDIINLECDDDFDIRCGEIYLNVKGVMQIHCTFCEQKFFDLFPEFQAHVELKHRPPNEILQQNSKTSGYNAFMVVLDDDESCTNSDFMEDIQDLEEYISESFDQCIPSPRRRVEILNAKKISCQTAKEKLQSKNINMEGNETPNLISNEFVYGEHAPRKLNINPTLHIKFKCPHCTYTGKDKANFNAHVKRHFSINKNKKCTQCPMTFHSSCELKRHLATHTGEKPFLCQECGKAYSNKHKLKAHFKRHQNLRDVPCTMCDKMFFSKQALEEHMAVHTDDRRYSCNMCKASFKLKKGLRTHLKIHENQLQYKCTLCPARFNQSPGLRSHMRTKHDAS